MKNHITKNRKIAILGTKGVPNNYGGFEQFADFLSRKLVKRGYDVTVYNPHYYDVGTDYKGVNIIYCWCPEKTFGSGIGNTQQLEFFPLLIYQSDYFFVLWSLK